MSTVEKNVIFLDLDVKILGRKIVAELNIKATDRHQYLHYTSSHPYHTKRSIVYSQALRDSKICSFENDFIRYRNEMKSWFLNRGTTKHYWIRRLAKLNSLILLGIKELKQKEFL